VANTLTPKQISAIERAKRTPDLQPILFRKAVGVHWFAAFKEAGFFHPTDIPPPTPAKEEGYVSIPVWPITDYLVATSPELFDPNNEEYAIEFLKFIRAATTHAKEHNYGNYRVWWQFSKIIRNIPPHLISRDDIALIDYWLDDLYERGLVAESLGEQWLISLLDRHDQHCRALSISLLDALYRIKFLEEQDAARNRGKAVLRFDSWHARKLTTKLATKVGRVLGRKAVKIFQNRLEHILEQLNNDKWSSIWRSAIEDHEQNHAADAAEDIIIEGYRDSLLAYIEEAPLEASEYLGRLLENPFETIRRIAIYAIDQRYPALSQMVDHVIVTQYFTSNFRHELWHLLHNHYPQFSTDQKQRVQDTIAALHEVDENGKQNQGKTAYRQALWFSAIKNYGDDVAQLHRKCIDVIGGEPKHPDFSSYMSGGWIEHESPIPIHDLLSLDVKQLVRQLGSYQDPGQFGEPGLKGLTKALHEAVKTEPLRFYSQLQEFSPLDLAYIYEVIEAYDELWTECAKLPWEELWGNLLQFCQDLVNDHSFWSPQNTQPRSAFVANRYWIVGEIARLIENGTRSDEHAFPEKYLKQAELVLLTLLENEKGEEFKPNSDAVSVAINSPRGRCIEAFINLTLRSCRLADKQHGDHAKVWMHFQPTYDSELARADIGEYEFSTLVVNYLPNFLYMSNAWVSTNLESIFDQNNYQKWLCAMQGYAYVDTVYEGIYNHLKEYGHLVPALDDENLNERVREKIIQNIAIAYTNDFERLADETSLIHQLLVRGRHREMGHLIWFLWTLRKHPDGNITLKVFELWPRILTIIDTNTRQGRLLASKLCDWIAFVQEVNDTNKPLILAVAPYANEDHHSSDFLESIARISERQPLEAYQIWRRLLDVAQPDYPKEAIQIALANLVRGGADGIRKAKDIVSEYLKHGYEGPWKLLREIMGVHESL
jgi:hypothetical protein